MFKQKQLLKAVERGALDEIEKILDGTNNACDDCIGTASLSQACAMNRSDIVDLLLKQGASPNYSCHSHKPPVVTANIDLDTAQINENTGDKCAPVTTSNTNLDPALTRNNSGYCFLTQRTNLHENSFGDSNRTILPTFRCVQYPLSVACRTRDIDFNIIRRLVDKGASVNAWDSSGSTALHIASEIQGKDIVEYLLENGAQVESPNDSRGKTALAHACAISSDPHVIELLLSAGSHVNAMDMHGQYPLNEAILNPFIGQEAVQLLLDAGADVTQDYYMFSATSQGTDLMMETLRRYGALIDPILLGKSALHVACELTAVSTERVLTLLKWGADVNRTCPFGMRPMEYACQDFQLEKVRVLMGWGADLNIMRFLTSHSWLWHLDWSSQYVALINLLVAGGLQVDLSLCRTLAVCVSRLPGRKGLRTKVTLFLKSLAQNPPTLTHLCRLVLRRALFPQIDENVEKLVMLPARVQSFLCLKENTVL